ncbi:spore germination protein (amino acid permease) [Brevibacillus sp. AG162]|uniref:GerAB/ArcD/ProY family transporter n=1 Tax=Brevibacillus sp. AG162 TaxID=2572910 RepID=UPI00114F4115|nr:GerAB/ArcD/ProY family transporter [Brevibacillus sp. AG162]TQK49624.1 spore germination protein (amino acid permease) [Brevibacillus sp. AG162]
MKVNDEVKAGNTISSLHTGFIVLSTQVGVGILGFQRVVAKEAGHDAWISVLMAGIVTHVTIWVILKTLKRYPSADLYGIHQEVYGKHLGAFLSLFYILYFFLSATIILRGYVEVVQTWVFPKLATWVLTAIILFLAWYTILGGIRIIAGYIFFSVSVAIWLVGDLFFPLRFAEWDYLRPVLEANIGQLLKGMIGMSLSTIGFEVLYAVYPFVQDKERLNRGAQFGALTTNLIYLFVMIVSLVFFSQGQLMRTIWPTLNLKKMVYFPILERFELVAISIWMIIILPNVIMYIWSGVRGLKRIFGWNMRNILYSILPIIFISSLFIVTREEMNTMNDIYGQIGMYLAYAYPYVLYLLVAWRQGTGGVKEESADVSVPK